MNIKLKNMKKAVSLLTAIILAVSVTGCGSQSTSQSSTSAAPSATPTSTSAGTPAELPVIRLDVVSTGTQAIPAYVMQELKLDKKYGFSLSIHKNSGAWGSEWTSLKTNAIDAAITDWVSVARNAAVKVYCVAPLMGWGNSLLVPNNSSIKSLSDLKGHKIGVYQTTALDWVMVNAAAQKEYKLNPGKDNQITESAAGLLMGLIDKGNVDAIFSYADTNVIQASTGKYRVVFKAGDCLKTLGLNNNTPFLFYTFTADYQQKHPEVVKNFVKAYQEAIDYLMQNDEIWSKVASSCFDVNDQKGVEVLKTTMRGLLMKSNTSTTEQDCQNMLDWFNNNGYNELVGIKTLPKGFVIAE